MTFKRPASFVIKILYVFTVSSETFGSYMTLVLSTEMTFRNKTQALGKDLMCCWYSPCCTAKRFRKITYRECLSPRPNGQLPMVPQNKETTEPRNAKDILHE